MRGATIDADRFDALAINDGMIEITGLAAGDYDLWLKETGTRIRLRIRVADGTMKAGYVLGKLRHLQLPALKPVQIAGIVGDAENVTDPPARFLEVHPLARLWHALSAGLQRLRRPQPGARCRTARRRSRSRPNRSISPGRNIGDEYRYVLDRRLQKKFPGNMLERPALLLNPWVVRSTETGEQHGPGRRRVSEATLLKEAGAGRRQEQRSPVMRWGEAKGGGAAGDFANLDFLYDASATLLNLIPDQGRLCQDSAASDSARTAMIHVLAVDPVNTTARSLSCRNRRPTSLICACATASIAKSHFTQQKQVNVLRAGQTFVLADAAASRFEVYDSLAKVYGLYSTLSHDPKLAEFAFVLTWPTLKIEEKKTLYSKFACHELSFFIAKKDPEFFRTIVKPYLVNKKDKTFLDHWLLEDDLQVIMQPWQHARLNTVERVLLAQRLAGEPTRPPGT